MKITTSLLALSALWNSISGFVVQRQTTTTPVALQSSLLGFDNASPIRIEGNTLKTWKIDMEAEKVLVQLRSDGRPVHAEISLWHGPNYTPTSMKCYLEDGNECPLNVIMKPKGYGMDTIQILNTAPGAFPATARVTQGGENPIYKLPESLENTAKWKRIQGAGMVEAYPLSNPKAKRVAVGVRADPDQNRNMKFMVELLKGPNTIKQRIEFYASSGYKTPFFAVFETPGPGYTVRLKNLYQVEFPINAYVESLES